MARTLIQQADVVTMDAAGRVLRETDVVVDGSLIVAVGQLPADFAPDEIVSARGQILMPGFFNAHLHSGTVLHRSVAADGADAWAPRDGDAAYWGALLAATEMIRGGAICFADHSYYMDRVADAIAGSGLRAVLAWRTTGREEGEIGGDLATVARFAEEWNGAASGRLHTALGPDSPHVCEPIFLARTAAVAARLGLGIHLHLAESEAQVAASLAKFGMSPVELLDKNGVFDVPVTAAHAIHLNHVDIDLLAERGAQVVYCPSAHTHRGLQRTAVALLRAAGVPVGIGTDGADAGYTLDMWQAIRDAAAFPFGESELSRFDALQLATREGAAMLRFPLSGQIEVNRSADLILIDRRRAHLWPSADPLAAILYGVQPGDVSDVMVGGEWLMRKRELLTVDEERVLWEVERRMVC